MTIDRRREWGSVDPFGDPNWLTDFTPDRIAIVAREGTTIAERFAPRAGFAGHTQTTPWDPLHRAYFNVSIDPSPYDRRAQATPV